MNGACDRRNFECLTRPFRAVFGAPEGSNLEPCDALGLLEELENWSDALKGEPEVIHRLAALAEGRDKPFEAPAPKQSRL